MREFASRPGRVPIEMSVGVTVKAESFVATSKNIGSGGIFLATDLRLGLGDRCTIEFTLPGHIRPMSVDAEVRWTHEEGDARLGAGLRFVNPSIAAMVAIYDLWRRADKDKTPSGRST